MVQPPVTVIVPIFNTERYLAGCVESILHQTYRELQILLVDDGSTDGSLALCESFALQDPRVRVLHQANKGASGARNLGLDHAEGEYVVFIDSDDTVQPRYIEDMYEAIAGSDAALVKTLWTGGGRLRGSSEIKKLEGKKLLNVKELPSYSMLYGIGGTMHRRSDIGEIRFDPEVRYGEDTEFNNEVLCRSMSQNAIFLKTAEYDYRIRPDSMTHTMDYRIYRTHIIALKKLLRMYDGMAPARSVRIKLDRYWGELFVRMLDSEVKAGREELRGVRKKALEARKRGVRPQKMKDYIYETLYLYHGKWIADCYHAIRGRL